ncbi:MAG: hypothetical protein EOP64_00780 [Sphingomonas sp.]|nr:MAG: hypothetical protein EOP64_00780 [Sphingomonas sp.]
MMNIYSLDVSKIRMTGFTIKLSEYTSNPLFFFASINIFRATLMYISGDTTLFNIDYALILIPACLMSRRGINKWHISSVSIALFIVAASFDALGFFGRLYRWGPDFYDSYFLGYNDLPWFEILPLVFLGLAVIVIFCLPLSTMQFRKKGILSLILLCGVIGAYDIYIEQSPHKDLDGEKNTLTSPIKFAFSNYIRAIAAGHSVKLLTEPTMDRIVRATAPTQILSVSLESLGLPILKADSVKLIEQPLRAMLKSYNISFSHHNFYGSTLQGEMRELCSLHVNGNPSHPEIVKYFSDCLPSFLSRSGYSTWGLHGNGGEIYNRKNVYPLIGFQHAVFYSDMASSPEIRPCEHTPFRGICDHDMYVRALRLFDGSRRFVHIMTLDTHLPVYPTAPSECSGSFRNNASLCGYSKAIMRSLNDLATTILHSNKKPDLIFIYGDHAPPFFSASTRQFFDGKQVPFIILKRKDDGRRR